MDKFFVLGARDPEMEEVSRVLDAGGIKWVSATAGGRTVNSAEAYQATGVSGLLPRAERQLVFVECDVLGLDADDLCDHHNPGDPGYALPPERYYEGSSLGQVLTLLGEEPTREQRLIAAADHCLAHAYRGECPGVDPAELADWRERSRAARFGLTQEEIRARIRIATEALARTERIKIGDEWVAWIPDKSVAPYELAEASARAGTPIAYVSHLTERSPYRAKCGILNAKSDTVLAWMRDCGLDSVYGAPARGYAGGYAA
ncbi:MAG: hypothetical protein ACP5P4_09740 [Steroidobacteraceae bacterium]